MRVDADAVRTGFRLAIVDNSPLHGRVRDVLCDDDSVALIVGEFNYDWVPIVQPVGGVVKLFEAPPEQSHEKHVLAKVKGSIFDSNLEWENSKVKDVPRAFGSRKAKERAKMLKSTPYCRVEDTFPVACWSDGRGAKSADLRGKQARIKGKNTTCPLICLCRVYELIPLCGSAMAATAAVVAPAGATPTKSAARGKCGTRLN
jgi:hypothetical protein